MSSVVSDCDYHHHRREGIMTERELMAQGIRRAILRSKYTPTEVARRLGMGASGVGKWVTAASMPTPKNLSRLARVLGVDQDTIRNGYPDFAEDDDAA
jgi:transcriptional regulator with XRE-family HTH domain